MVNSAGLKDKIEIIPKKVKTSKTMHLSMWSTKVGRMERKQVEVTVVNMKQV